MNVCHIVTEKVHERILKNQKLDNCTSKNKPSTPITPTPTTDNNLNVETTNVTQCYLRIFFPFVLYFWCQIKWKVKCILIYKNVYLSLMQDLKSIFRCTSHPLLFYSTFSCYFPNDLLLLAKYYFFFYIVLYLRIFIQNRQNYIIELKVGRMNNEIFS